jgi:hypothetical protein
MTIQAQQAIRAAKGIHQWGPYAAQRYAEKLNIPGKLLSLAKELEYEDREYSRAMDAALSKWSK